MPDAAFFVVMGHVVAAVVLGTSYFRRYRIARPPIGVFTSGDVAALLVGIVLVPQLYLLLPRWLVAGLLGLAAISILLPMLEPLLHNRWLSKPTTVILVIGNACLAGWLDAFHPATLLVNNLVLVLVAIGVANLWVQSGMRAQHVTLLAGGLMVYDLVATSLLGVTDDLFNRLWGLPFAPLLAWPVGAGQWLGIGLGDLLLATVFPLVMHKAFGRAAGITALAFSLGTIAVLLVLLTYDVVRVTIPVMGVLSPLLLLHYLCWRQRGRERTTGQYWAAEGMR